MLLLSYRSCVGHAFPVSLVLTINQSDLKHGGVLRVQRVQFTQAKPINFGAASIVVVLAIASAGSTAFYGNQAQAAR